MNKESSDNEPKLYPSWLDKQVENDSVVKKEKQNVQTKVKSEDSYRISSSAKADKKQVRNFDFNTKMEEFCHKHRKCLICDLNDSEENMKHFVDIQRLIAASGKPNYLECRIPVISKLNITFLRSILAEYDDKLICDLLEFGFPIGFEGEIYDNKKPKNHSGAREYEEFIMQYLQKELNYQAIIGPFKYNPFIGTELILSPLNTVPKSTTGDRRVILDLSFPQENSVNSHISKDVYLGEQINLKYPSVDSLVDLIKQKGKGCHIFKRDLKRAYRQIPIDPGDVHLVGFHWRNHLFVDRVLSMGLRSSAYFCQRVTSVITYIMAQSGYMILNYLDDFAGAETPNVAEHVFNYLGSVLKNCGLEESVEKACPPCTCMTFLGVLFDTETLTLSVTEERVAEILLLVQEWLNKSEATLRELQSLLGKLHFISNCIRPGRLFVSRLLTWLRSLPDDKNKHVIPCYVKKDLLWWSQFLVSYNGVSMMSLEDWTQPDECLESDATLKSCGGWFIQKREFFHVEFPQFILELELSINQFELLAVMICVKVWSSEFNHKKILLKCDNQSTVSVLNSGSSRDAFMQGCLREIQFYAAKYEFEVRSVYFPGVENRTADLLSRWNIENEKKFFDLPNVKSANCFEKFVYDGLFRFSHNW